MPLPRMHSRRIVQLDEANISVSAESHLAIEWDLDGAVAVHPDVLSEEDIGLGRSS